MCGLLFLGIGVFLIYRNRKARQDEYDVSAGPSAVVVNDAGPSGGANRSVRNEIYSAPLSKSTKQSSPSSAAGPIGLDTVGSRVTVLGYPGQGTLRYYGRHAYMPGFRCGVELDGAHGNNDGSVKGYFYFKCAEGHGVLVDVRKVTLLEGDTRTSMSPVRSVDHAAASIGDDGIADGDSKQVQITALERQLRDAEDRFAVEPKRRPSAKYDAAERASSKNRYRDIAPYDDNRVELKGHNDYINASFVRFESPADPLNAICCQGPKEDTIDDTWELIAQYNVRGVTPMFAFSPGDELTCVHFLLLD